MNLADICERHNNRLYGPKEKKARSYRPSKEQGRRSHIPSQEEARKEDKRKYGGKEANDERIARNKEKDEKRWHTLKIAKMEEDLEKERWRWARNIKSPSPRRSGSRQGPTEIFYRDGRRESSPGETFRGPRRDHDQRPGTSTGSHPSGGRYTDFRVRRVPSDNEEEEEVRTRG